jgi:hypothetical protein
MNEAALNILRAHLAASYQSCSQAAAAVEKQKERLAAAEAAFAKASLASKELDEALASVDATRVIGAPVEYQPLPEIWG